MTRRIFSEKERDSQNLWLAIWYKQQVTKKPFIKGTRSEDNLQIKVKHLGKV